MAWRLTAPEQLPQYREPVLLQPQQTQSPGPQTHNCHPPQRYKALGSAPWPDGPHAHLCHQGPVPDPPHPSPLLPPRSTL